jgi:hypothetical protein
MPHIAQTSRRPPFPRLLYFMQRLVVGEHHRFWCILPVVLRSVLYSSSWYKSGLHGVTYKWQPWECLISIWITSADMPLTARVAFDHRTEGANTADRNRFAGHVVHTLVPENASTVARDATPQLELVLRRVMWGCEQDLISSRYASIAMATDVSF